jgi:hypothetical protein
VLAVPFLPRQNVGRGIGDGRVSQSFVLAASFDPHVTQLMGEAFELARKALHDTGQPEAVQEIIAKRIIESARRGVRDPRQMCEEALSALGIHSACD